MTIVDDLIPHMRRVQSAERDLRDLALLWQMIEASSAISCPEDAESILPMLAQTRERFAALQRRLVEQLGRESLAELHDELASAAQCAVDILVRNLYERSADVGFLATDEALRAHCAAAPAERATGRAALVRRLGEYCSKYSVYDDVVVVSPDGEVLARLDEGAALERTTDPIVAAAVSRPGYVERLGRSDFGADPARPAMLYGHRIDGAAGRCIGVVVLRFRGADEMERIFAGADSRRMAAVVLLDASGRVLASNDQGHVPLGTILPTAPDDDIVLVAFGGREYLCVTRAARPYQGYSGPAGWRAQAMVSVQTAFRSRADDSDATGRSITLDHPELQRIQSEGDEINSDLRRVVWNGRILAGVKPEAQARLKAVLGQINEAGTRTRARVDAAIADLHRTSLGRARHQALELARLAADIIDRNLYERANDCRWWALSPQLGRVLAAPASASAASSAELSAMLAHANSLYPVYARIVAFDADGVVRAASNDADPEAPLVGTTVDAALTQPLAALVDSQRYAVTPFAPSTLAGGAPTYVYLAAVRAGGRPLGGIALVFDAARELRAMLGDVLGGRAGIAAFVDADNRIVASTADDLAPGTPLPFGAETIADHAGSRYAVARVRATGYREFKQQDGYDNGVSAVVALRLGAADHARASLQDAPLVALPTTARGQAREFAFFSVGAGRYGVPSSRVIEARPEEGLVRAPIGVPELAGLLEVPDRRDSRVIPVVAARKLLGVPHDPRPGDGVVIVVSAPDAPGRPSFGLLVDAVASVLDIGPEHVQPAPEGLRGHAPHLVGIMQLATGEPASGQALAQLLDVDAIARLVVPQRAAAREAAATAG